MTHELADFIGTNTQAIARLELDRRHAQVLAIGSQLAHGSVGLNASLPVYQSHGIRYAAVPATILSVLPHYPQVHQVILDDDWFELTFADLEASGALTQLQTVASGYLATPRQVEILAEWWQQFQPRNPQCELIVDPTFGDIGLGYYNDPAVVAPVRHKLLSQAVGGTPNLFELASLAELDSDSLTDLEQITATAQGLLVGRTQWLVVTGLRGVVEHPDHTISELVVTREGATAVSHELLPGAPSGVGDVFTAHLITNLIHGTELQAAVKQAGQATAGYINPLS